MIKIKECKGIKLSQVKSFKHEALAHAQKLQPEPKSTNYKYDYASKICQTWKLLFFRF